jgi:hypothetical protein
MQQTASLCALAAAVHLRYRSSDSASTFLPVMLLSLLVFLLLLFSLLLFLLLLLT